MSEEVETGPTDEDRARQVGWTDKDEWVAQGRDPDLHRSASDFMAKQEENAALAIKNARRLSDQVHQQQKAIVAITERMEKAHKAEVKSLEAKLEQYAKEGDTEKIQETIKEIRDKDKETIPQVNNDAINQAARAFVDRVPEFNTDPIVAAAARELEAAVTNDPTFAGSSPSEIYGEVEKRLKTELPHKFQSQEEVTPRKTVTPAGRPAARSGKLTFASIPKEDQEQYKTVRRMFESRGKSYSKDDFMKTYIAENQDA